MTRLRWLGVAACVLILAGGAGAIVHWYRSAGVLKLAVAPGEASSQQFLQSLARHAGKVAIELIQVGDQQAALDALRTGKAQLAAVRVDEHATGDIRAVAILSSRYMIQSDVAKHSDADLTYAKERISQIVARTISIGTMTMAAARRVDSPPRGLLTRASLKLSEEQADKLWYLGAARDEPDEADDWRGQALLLSRMLVTVERIDRQVIHDVAMAVTDVVRAGRADSPGAREVSLVPIEEGKSILRAHDGVARFINREGQGFFERYGDLVYVGMSVVGVMLTAVGGLLAWLRYRMADNGRRHLSRMRVLVEQAAMPGAQVDRIEAIATKLAMSVADDIVKRKIAYDVLAAYEILQRALYQILHNKRDQSNQGADLTTHQGLVRRVI